MGLKAVSQCSINDAPKLAVGLSRFRLLMPKRSQGPYTKIGLFSFGFRQSQTYHAWF